jgi:hypothetical protein
MEFTSKAQCIFVVRRGEYDERLLGESRQQFKSGHPRHLDIEKQHVDGSPPGSGEKTERLGGIGGAAGDFYFIVARQQACEPLQGQRLVIHEIGAQRCGWHGGR